VNQAINKTKRLPNEWKKIFANDISDNGLISKIYKELIYLKIKEEKKKTTLLKNGHRTWTDIFWVANRRMKIWSTSLIIREMQMKTTVQYLLTHVTMTIIKNTRNKYWQGCGEKEPSCAVA
jgi:hypothetical protein